MTARNEARARALSMIAAGTAVACLGLAACTTVIREPAPRATHVVVREMPAPIVEAPPPPPQPGWHWRPGHWAWHDNGGWRWQGGEWVATAVPPMPPVIIEQVTVAPSPVHFWVRGHWVWRGGGWFWVGGHWVRG